MAIEIKVPDIGADEVEITEILVKVGDKVEAEQSLITVEGDKASMEVPSPQAGVVKEIKVSVGDKTETGKLIMIFDSADGAAAAAPAQEEKKEAAPAAAAPAAASAKEVHVPDIGGDEVEVTEIMVKVGDTIAAEQSLITVEGDKASMEVPSPQAGVVKEIKVSVGDKTETGKLIMIFDSADGAAAAAPAQEEKKEAAPAAAAPAAASAKEVHVPDIGGDEVEVTEIMVKVGDTIAAEQSLITVEGDKASMEVPAPFAGTVKEIKINTGDKVSTGSLIMIFEVAGAAPAAAPAKAEAAPAAAAPAASGSKEVHVPDIGGDEVEVTEVMVKVGDKIAAEQSLITVEGDKASMEVPAPFAGTVKEIKISTGDKVSTGSLIMVFEVEGAAPAAAPAKQEAAAPAAAPAQAAKPMRWSMILPGTWPLRKPGTFTCLAISLRAASRYGLSSSGSTVTVSFTLVGSRLRTLIFTLMTPQKSLFLTVLP